MRDVPTGRATLQYSFANRNGQTALGVDGDRQLLTRAIINLIGNAIKYSDDGMEIRCALANADGRIRLTIADQGAGMTEEQLSKLFRPFHTTKTNGNGLGLATTRKIIIAHGGSIDVQSEPGRGTKFTIRLPAAG